MSIETTVSLSICIDDDQVDRDRVISTHLESVNDNALLSKSWHTLCSNGTDASEIRIYSFGSNAWVVVISTIDELIHSIKSIQEYAWTHWFCISIYSCDQSMKISVTTKVAYEHHRSRQESTMQDNFFIT